MGENEGVTFDILYYGSYIEINNILSGKTYTATFPILPFEKYVAFVETCGDATIVASKPDVFRMK